MKLSQILTVALAFFFVGIASAQSSITIKTDSIEGCNPSTVKFSYTTNIDPVNSILWKFDNTMTSTDTNPSTVYDKNGIYKVELIINSNDTGRYTLDLTGCLNIPNVFTPNGDTKNDYFEVNYDDKTVLIIKIFTRTGTLVYSRSAIKISWDGYLDSGDKILQGTYFYTIESVGINPVIKKKGFVYVFY